jgi:hypothetical protein
MLLLLLAGCALFHGPLDAFTNATTAFQAHDVDAFGRAVDIDALAADLVPACATLELRLRGLEDNLFKADGLENMLLPLVENALKQPEFARSVADAFRKDLRDRAAAPPTASPGPAPADASPDVLQAYAAFASCGDARISGRPTLLDHHGDDAHAALPLSVLGNDVQVDVRLHQKDGVWQITHVDATEPLRRLEVDMLKRARGKALTRAQALARGHDPDEWDAVRNYLSHASDGEIQGIYEGTLTKLEAATPPLTVQESGMVHAGFLGAWRDAVAVVHNPSKKTATAWTVRFAFTDENGGRLAVSRVATTVAPLRPGQKAVSSHVRVDAPNAVDLKGTVVAVDWDDATHWIHPAVEAGAWRLE